MAHSSFLSRGQNSPTYCAGNATGCLFNWHIRSLLDKNWHCRQLMASLPLASTGKKTFTVACPIMYDATPLSKFGIVYLLPLIARSALAYLPRLFAYHAVPTRRAEESALTMAAGGTLFFHLFLLWRFWQIRNTLPSNTVNGVLHCLL